jgi:hypothetical protein
MIRIDDPHSINLISRATRVQFVPMLHHCIALYNSTDRLVSGVLFTDWNRGSVLLHCAVFPPKGALGRDLIWLTFQYAFNQLKVKKMIALVPEWNYQSRNISLKLGFKIEYKMDDVFNNPEPILNGMYIMSMTREECRWLNMKEPEIVYASVEKTNKLVWNPPVGEGITLH